MKFLFDEHSSKADRISRPLSLLLWFGVIRNLVVAVGLVLFVLFLLSR